MTRLQWFAKGPVKNKFAFYGRRGVRLARREEGAYRQYSADEERRQTGWIGGQKCEVILDRALRPVAGHGGGGRRRGWLDRAMKPRSILDAEMGGGEPSGDHSGGA